MIRVPIFVCEVAEGLEFRTFSRVGPDKKERKQIGWVGVEASCQVNRNAFSNPDCNPLVIWGEKQQLMTAEMAFVYGKANVDGMSFEAIEETK